MSFSETDHIYAAMDSVLGRGSSESGLDTISIKSDHVRQFHAALGAFRRHLLESEISDEWATFLRAVKRWFHLYVTTPVEGYSLLPLCPKIEGLDRLKQNSQPFTGELFDVLNTKFQILLQSKQHPFFDQILDSIPEKYQKNDKVENEQERPYRLGVVVEGRRVCQYISQWFDNFDVGIPVHVVTPSDLKKESLFDQLILMGCPRWFALSGSMHVLNSPRANQLTFMGFEPFFTPPTSENFYFFAGSPHLFASASARGLVKSPACQNFTVLTDEECIDSDMEGAEPISTSQIDEIIPTIDSSKVFSSFTQSDQGDESEVTAPCHFGRLSANTGIFLNIEASIYRILLRPTTGAKLICNDIEKTPVTALSPGDIVMFSTHGAGDMTAIIANSLLGTSASTLREKQEAWKMKVSFLFESPRELRNRGISSATDTNFKNWLRPNTIMPGNRRDFYKLLLLAGYSEEEAADTIISMRRIAAAHQSAGRKVAQKLRKSVKGTHLNQLGKIGMQELYGELGTAAKMKAYIIEQIDHREYELPVSKLNHPFELTDDLWLA